MSTDTAAARQLMAEDIMGKVIEVLDAAKATTDPAEQLQALGKALQQIGACLSGLSLDEARRVIWAVRALVIH